MLNILQSHSITKNTSVNVYEFTSDSLNVIAGLNQEKPKKYKVYEDRLGNYYFNFRGIKVYLYNTSNMIQMAI